MTFRNGHQKLCHHCFQSTGCLLQIGKWAFPLAAFSAEVEPHSEMSDWWNSGRMPELDLGMWVFWFQHWEDRTQHVENDQNIHNLVVDTVSKAFAHMLLHPFAIFTHASSTPHNQHLPLFGQRTAPKISQLLCVMAPTFVFPNWNAKPEGADIKRWVLGTRLCPHDID